MKTDNAVAKETAQPELTSELISQRLSGLQQLHGLSMSLLTARPVNVEKAGSRAEAQGKE